MDFPKFNLIFSHLSFFFFVHFCFTKESQRLVIKKFSVWCAGHVPFEVYEHTIMFRNLSHGWPLPQELASRSNQQKMYLFLKETLLWKRKVILWPVPSNEIRASKTCAIFIFFLRPINMADLFYYLIKHHERVA